MSFAMPVHKNDEAAPTRRASASQSLRIGEANSAYEREADRVADAIVTRATPGLNWSLADISINPRLQRQCDCNGSGECAQCTEDKPKGKMVQRSADGAGVGGVAPSIVQEVLNSFGTPLDTATRNFFEPRFGADFSRVRIHTDARAAASARAVNATAYTVGESIVFNRNKYSRDSSGGRRLLAHELAHVVQQLGKGGRSEIIARQRDDKDQAPPIEHQFEVQPHVVPMNAHAVPERRKCEEFPGGSTDCEVDETGTPTGKVTHRIEETNPCTKPCVEAHEAVHMKQMKTFCPQLKACYLAADKRKRPVTDCVKMAVFGGKERECPAYNVSVPCVEKRLKTAKECQSKDNKEYGARKLASEQCFHDMYCDGAGTK
jgi:hypothetical protein